MAGPCSRTQRAEATASSEIDLDLGKTRKFSGVERQFLDRKIFGEGLEYRQLHGLGLGLDVVLVTPIDEEGYLRF
jgi:hypothetical protein